VTTADLGRAAVVGPVMGRAGAVGSGLPATAGPAAAGVAALGLCVAVNLVDPNEQGSWGVCPFLAVTGLYCPGCGTLRAVRALTRGDVIAAASLNVMTVALVGGLLWALASWTSSGLYGRAVFPQIPGRVGTMVAALVPLFVVARNLDVTWLAWLAP